MIVPVSSSSNEIFLFISKNFFSASCSIKSASIIFLVNSLALPSRIGISILSISIIILSISAPTIAAKICSTVWISVSSFFNTVLLDVEKRFLISALILGLFLISVLTNTIPVLT